MVGGVQEEGCAPQGLACAVMSPCAPCWVHGKRWLGCWQPGDGLLQPPPGAGEAPLRERAQSIAGHGNETESLMARGKEQLVT